MRALIRKTSCINLFINDTSANEDGRCYMAVSSKNDFMKGSDHLSKIIRLYIEELRGCFYQ